MTFFSKSKSYISRQKREMASSDETKIAKLLRIGVRFQPAAVTLLYEEKQGKKRVRVMPVRKLSPYGPVSLPLAELKMRHSKYIEGVPDIRIEKLLRLLQETAKGNKLEDALEILSKEFGVDPNQDLNKVSDDVLKKKKKIMDSSYSQNKISPGDPNYEYDKREEFDAENVEAAGWDSGDDSGEFWE